MGHGGRLRHAERGPEISGGLQGGQVQETDILKVDWRFTPRQGSRCRAGA